MLSVFFFMKTMFVYKVFVRQTKECYIEVSYEDETVSKIIKLVCSFAFYKSLVFLFYFIYFFTQLSALLVMSVSKARFAAI